MSGEAFSARVATSERGTVIALVGTVNREAKQAMDDAYAEASRSDGEILLDFGGVDYINSTGIAVIVGLLAIARGEKREIGAMGLTDHYREVFEITRLADFMHIYEDTTADS